MQLKFFRIKGISFSLGDLIDVKWISRLAVGSLIDGPPLIIFWMVDRSLFARLMIYSRKLH